VDIWLGLQSDVQQKKRMANEWENCKQRKNGMICRKKKKVKEANK
jgi:hypothetical protein